MLVILTENKINQYRTRLFQGCNNSVISQAPDLGGFFIGGVMKEIILTQGRVTLVDDDLFEFLNQWKWNANRSRNTFYARKEIRINKKKKTVSLHHYVVGFPLNKLQVDHVNGNGLDNQRHNLRIVTHRQNTQNMVNKKRTSEYPGVSWYKPTKKWIVHIRIKKKVRYVGYFPTEIEAFNAYKQECERIGEPCL